ncbi:hypothetical protein ANI02nite_34770 [Acetobacter nitrogenifigens DSM 23921 = NBRC 105050]|uniref:Uncharacterized protein n=2 Tax=Acetobacter nitrogenifigens TaxID=285268 RepID=A0A511XF66_9PROT|nr:hypothetical protein ANI02nite_34770 [Acetobacter nitrogenifigens DSM 23921 = NBRC 105050]
MSSRQRVGRARALRLMDDENPVEIADGRSQDLASQVTISGEVVDVIKEVFAGTSVLNDQNKVSQILAARAEISEKWGQARDAFLSIGRSLLELENVLSKSEYLRLRSGTERLFPFSDATATQFRQIARAVDTGKIPLEKCPGSYGTAYQITLLTDVQLQLANERGLIRPDVTRKEILSLRREVQPVMSPGNRVDVGTLREEKRRLTLRQNALEAELQEIRRRLTELTELVG